ncbi:MAG: BBP7 family outer membrane beta-barrel protein [Gemmataceae bacterium]
MVCRRVRLLTNCLAAVVLAGAAAGGLRAEEPMRKDDRLFASEKAAALPTSLPSATLSPQVGGPPQAGANQVSLPPSTISALACGETRPECPAPAAATPAESDELFWVSAEYLLWWIKSSPVAFPLVTTSSLGPLVPGGLSTVSLFGQEPVNGNDPVSGLRLRVGSYSSELDLGVDLGGFFLANQGTDFASAGLPVLARPFVNATTGQEVVNYLTYPNAISGSATVSLESRLWGGEVNLTRRVGWGPIEAVYGGFRYLGLREELNLQDRSTLVPGGIGFFDGQPIGEGDVRFKQDLFRTQTNFYGGQVGFLAAVRQGRFDMNVRSAVGLGAAVQQVTVRGSSTLVATDGTRRTLEGGLLALRSNSGSEGTTRLAVMPEVDFTVGYQVTPWGRLFVGYNFLYLSSVVRPGDQLDRTVDVRQLPISPTYDPAAVTASPRPQLNASDFWTQGLNFGLAVSF